MEEVPLESEDIKVPIGVDLNDFGNLEHLGDSYPKLEKEYLSSLGQLEKLYGNIVVGTVNFTQLPNSQQIIGPLKGLKELHRAIGASVEHGLSFLIEVSNDELMNLYYEYASQWHASRKAFAAIISLPAVKDAIEKYGEGRLKLILDLRMRPLLQIAKYIEIAESHMYAQQKVSSQVKTLFCFFGLFFLFTVY